MASVSTVALGVVVGFPLLSALALQHITAARSLVFIGLLPLSTAIFGVIRGKERPRPAFWIFALLGSACVSGFALATDTATSWRGDLLLHGATLTRRTGHPTGGR